MQKTETLVDIADISINLIGNIEKIHEQRMKLQNLRDSLWKMQGHKEDVDISEVANDINSIIHVLDLITGHEMGDCDVNYKSFYLNDCVAKIVDR